MCIKIFRTCLQYFLRRETFKFSAPPATSAMRAGKNKRIESTRIAYAKHCKPRKYSRRVLPDEIRPLTVEYKQNLKVGVEYGDWRQVLKQAPAKNAKKYLSLSIPKNTNFEHEVPQKHSSFGRSIFGKESPLSSNLF